MDSNPPKTPKELQAWYDYQHSAPDESDIIKQEMARAQALRKQEVPQPPATGFAGGFLAGLARGIQNFQASNMERQALARQSDVNQQKRQNALVSQGIDPAAAPKGGAPAASGMDSMPNGSAPPPPADATPAESQTGLQPIIADSQDPEGIGAVPVAMPQQMPNSMDDSDFSAFGF